MTSERIASLRRWGESYPSGPDVDPDNVPRNVVRLLDEREALLGALRDVEWCGDSFQGFAAVCPACVAHEGKPHEPDCALAAALAKAESP